MTCLSDDLKAPLSICSAAFLSVLNDPENCEIVNEPTGIINTVATVVMPIFAAIGAFFSTPLWLAGELIEVFNDMHNEYLDEKVELPETAADDVTLCPDKTKYLGFPVSTYQYTADENFCKDSDWGVYNKENFNKEKKTEHLKFGQGIDILTDEGMKTLCDDTLRAGGNTLRFSVEWADVLNKDGSFNDVAMQRYVKTAKYIEERGLKPMVVLHHFVSPLDENGRNIFESKESVDKFVDYAKYVYTNMKDHVDCFLTFNEPKVQTAQNYILGFFPAGGIANFAKCEISTRNMLDAHVKTYKALHELAKDKKITVGMTHQSLRFVTSSRWNILSRVMCFALTHLFHNSFMDWAVKNKDSLDILGVQYYARPLAGMIPMPTCEEGGKMVEAMRIRFDPAGILPVLRSVNNQLGGDVELFVSETGTAGKNYLKATSPEEQTALDEIDGRREEYMTKSLKAVRLAQDEGIPVSGYMPWAPRRNGEWNDGFLDGTDFGLVVHDLKTLEQRDTKGFEVLKKVFENTVKAQTSKDQKAG